MECESTIGKIEEGYDGDVVIISGHPFLDIHSKVVTTIIGGNIVYDNNEK